MNSEAIIIALDIILAAANTAAAVTQFQAIVNQARAEGRDVSDAELRALATENQVKLDSVLGLLQPE